MCSGLQRLEPLFTPLRERCFALPACPPRLVRRSARVCCFELSAHRFSHIRSPTSTPRSTSQQKPLSARSMRSSGPSVRPQLGSSLVALANLHFPLDEVYFTIKPSAGIQATSFTAGDKVCIATDKLLPIERFLPQPKAAGVAKKSRGRGGAAGGRGRGGDRGRGGRGGGRGAPRGGRLVFSLS